MTTLVNEKSTDNNFGVFRLIFSYLVVVSHSAELIDGDSHREPLRRIFGTLTLGGVAVYGFFLVSGFLIAKSYLSSTSTGDYLLKRVVRILPGYAVAFFFSLFFVGHCAGGSFVGLNSDFWIVEIKRFAFLQEPLLPGAFSGSFFPHLNGSMWTISYEFRCYLLIALLGAVAVLRRPWLMLLGAAILLVLAATPFALSLRWSDFFDGTVGAIRENIQLTSAFAVGACVYLFRDRLFSSKLVAIIAFVMMIVSLDQPLFAVPGLIIFGGYALFFLIFWTPSSFLSGVGRRTDISYGIYLYAFPIQKMLISAFPLWEPYAVTAATMVLVTIVAFLSWTFVERPALRIRSFVLAKLTPLGKSRSAVSASATEAG